MEKSSFFNAVINGGVPDRSYLAEDFARYFSTFIGNGVFPNPSDQLQVIATEGNMNIRIKKGCAWINGYFYENTDEYILKLNPADGVLDRTDRVVLKLDFLERKIKAVVKQGDWNSNPVPKELQRDENAYEIALADVKVKHGIIGINAGDIIDLRLNKNLCGIVHGTIEQVDTTEIFNQYTRYLNAKLNSNEFSDWLDKLKNKLDPNSDLAAQLQLQIDSLQLTAENVTLNDNNFKSKNVKGALNELFTFADNGKKGIVNVIGNPLNANDSFSTIKNKTNNIKSNFVTKLASKGIYKNYNDNLQSLVDSIDNIKALKTLKGSSGLTSWETYSSGASWTAMKNLTFNITTGFQPKMILINGEYKGLRYIYPFRLMIYVEQNKYVKVSSYNNVENAVFYYNADHETLIAEITPNSNGFIFKITNESWPANFEYKDAFKIDYTVVGG